MPHAPHYSLRGMLLAMTAVALAVVSLKFVFQLPLDVAFAFSILLCFWTSGAALLGAGIAHPWGRTTTGAVTGAVVALSAAGAAAMAIRVWY
jgi:hypothetical protein